MGHTKVRCPEPVKEADDGGFGATEGTGGYDAPEGSGATTAGGDEWAVAAPSGWTTAPPATTVGGGGQDGW